MKTAKSVLSADDTKKTGMKDGSDMRNTNATRIKRTLIALLLMFVLSFSTAFAETDGENGAAAENGTQTETATEVTTETTNTDGNGGSQGTEVQQETPAAETPAPAPVSHIVKKGKYYYYKYSNGKIRKKAGFVTDLGKKYYVRKGGRIRTSKTFRIKKKYYRANKYGVIMTGVYKWKGKLNYSNAAGQWKKTAGFVSWNGNTYYVRKGGAIITNEAFAINNIPYDADAYGRVTRLDIPDGDGDPVINVAKSQVGIKTGKTYWVWYYKTKFKNTDKTPWCGAFVAWCYDQAGQYDRVTVAKKYGPLGYVPTYSSYANKYKKWVSIDDAQPGDIIVFGRNMHVGLVEGTYGDYIFTIEGNAGPTAAWGSKKPGAVIRNVYRKNSSKIKGVIRP